MPIEYSEEDIIKGCKEDNRAMQEVVYRRHYSDYMKVCLRYASCEPDAKQLLNDAFYKIFSHINQYNYDGPFAAWMRRIVVNTCLDHVKQKMRREKKEKLVENDKLPDILRASENTALGKIGFNEIIKQIQELPEKHRTVFNLNVFEGMSHKEIAKELNISYGTSQWYLSKAKELLREKISINNKIKAS